MRMTLQTKLRIVRWVAIPLGVVGLRFIAGGRFWNFMEDHLWLTVVLPLVALFLLLLARGMYMQYRREPERNSKLGGAQNAKP